MYGSPRTLSAQASLGHLNEGLAEGAAYRGRIMLAVNTTILDPDAGGPIGVTKERMKSSSKVGRLVLSSVSAAKKLIQCHAALDQLSRNLARSLYLLCVGPQVEVAPKREFLLFTALYSASMIDKQYKGKKIYFEVSQGECS